MYYRCNRILGNRIRVTDTRGKPVAMYDCNENKEYRWVDNRWKISPVQAGTIKSFLKRYWIKYF